MNPKDLEKVECIVVNNKKYCEINISQQSEQMSSGLALCLTLILVVIFGYAASWLFDDQEDKSE